MSHDPATDTASTQATRPAASFRVEAQTAATLAVQYLHSRQSPSGGFCFYRWHGIDEPSLADTWHAIATLTLLGATVPRRRETIAFLQRSHETSSDALYYRTLALKHLAVRLDAATLARVAELDAAHCLVSENLLTTARFERALQIVTLQQQIARIRGPETVGNRVRDLCREGGWGDKPNLPDTWTALAILEACGMNVAGTASAEFVESLQCPSFGFTATRDSANAPLEVLHAGLRACAVLQLPVRHLSDAVSCVLACQSSAGGFARSSGALPDIELTHLGVLALAAASALPIPSLPGWQADAGL